MYSMIFDESKEIDIKCMCQKTNEALFFFRTQNEISVLTETGAVSSYSRADSGWVGFELVGEFPFTVYGLLEKVLHPLVEQQIPVLVESSYKTDYIFIKNENFDKAVVALEESGFQILL